MRGALADHAGVAVWITHTTEGIGLRQELAGAGSRMLAGMIDLSILLAALLAAVVALLLFTHLDPLGGSNFLLGLLVGGWLLLLVAYATLFELAWQGATPGLKALSLRVRSLDGGPASALQSLLRNCFLPLDLFLLLPLPLGLLLMCVTPLAQRLGDLAAGTMVVRLPRGLAAPAREPWPGERWSTLQQRKLPLAPALSARFSRAEVAFLRALLARGEPLAHAELDAEARRKLYVETAREYCGRIGVARFDDARVVLRELYLFLREMQSARAPAAPLQRTRSSGR